MSDTHTTVMATVEPTALPARMHPLVGAAMAQGQSLDPETLSKLLDVQQRYEAAEAKKAYTAAMVGLKNDLPTVLARDQLVKFKDVKYTHTSLAHAVEKVVPILTCHGFSHSWIPRTADRKVEVTCRLTHSEGHSEECTLDSEPDKSGMKSGPQAIASTITLLQRYSLLALLGIATADMKEPDADRDTSAEVNPDRNLNAVAKLAKLGIKRELAEKHVGRPVDRWTGADIEKLRDDVEALKAQAKRPEPAATE